MRLSIKARAPTPRPTPARVGIGGPATRKVTITPNPVEDNPTEPVFFASANLSQSTTRVSSSESWRSTSRFGSVLIALATDAIVGATPASPAFLTTVEQSLDRVARHGSAWRIDPGDAGVAPTDRPNVVDHRLVVLSPKKPRSPRP